MCENVGENVCEQLPVSFEEEIFEMWMDGDGLSHP